jgi:hypothetical protein
LARDSDDGGADMKLLQIILCLAGIHNWYEHNINFFDPREVNEECRWCATRRQRFDKKRYKREVL